MKKANIFFIVSTSIILIFSFINTIFNNKEIIEYENRTAYNYKTPTVNSVVNKEFQDNIELTLGDQIPFATLMKKIYNSLNSIINYNVMKTLVKNDCDNNYISILPGLTIFGCDDIIVFPVREFENEKTNLDLRIENINNFIKNTNEEIYIYYIEKDTDINFKTNKKTNVGKYVLDNINTNNKHIYEINNFNEFKRDFFKTDHHWNLEGSYRAYLELTNLLKIKEPLKYTSKKCFKDSLTGSKANISGASILFKEDFCIYNFDLNDHKTFINKEETKYYSVHNIKNIETITSYAMGYGNDYAEIIFDFNQNDKENILIFGESYDNAILELTASHYNKTYSIDLRHYEKTFNNKFNYKEYIKDKDIDKVIFIGNIDFYSKEDFNIEVK